MTRRSRRRARRAVVSAPTVTIGSIIETGLWCDHCLLPSGVRFQILAEGTPAGTCLACHDCGAPLNEPT